MFLQPGGDIGAARAAESLLGGTLRVAVRALLPQRLPAAATVPAPGRIGALTRTAGYRGTRRCSGVAGRLQILGLAIAAADRGVQYRLALRIGQYGQSLVNLSTDAIPLFGIGLLAKGVKRRFLPIIA